MIVYTNTLNYHDLAAAAERLPAVYLASAELVDKRTRRFERVRLSARTAERPEGWRSFRAPHNPRSAMGGIREMPQHATYDEHGRWMAEIFDRDPRARIKSAIHDFVGRDDFHRQTQGRYAQHSSAWGDAA